MVEIGEDFISSLTRFSSVVYAAQEDFSKWFRVYLCLFGALQQLFIPPGKEL